MPRHDRNGPTPCFRPWPKQHPYPGPDGTLQQFFEHYYSLSAGYEHLLARIDENDSEFEAIRYRMNAAARMAVTYRQRLRIAAGLQVGRAA